MPTAAGKHSVTQEADGRWVVRDSDNKIKDGPFTTRELAHAAAVRLDAKGRTLSDMLAEVQAAFDSVIARQQGEGDVPPDRPGGPSM